MNKLRNIFKYFVFIFAILFFMALFIFNYKNNDFFEMDLYKIFSLACIIFVSYYLTQKNLDSRKQKEIVNNIIDTIMETTYKMNMDALFTDNCKLFILHLRSIENKLILLKSVSNKFDFEKEVDYIDGQVKTIKTMVSNHIGKTAELQTVYVDIEKNITNIRNKIDLIIFKLYFENIEFESE